MTAEGFRTVYADTGIYPAVTYLFIDDLFISRMENLQRSPCQPTKIDGPILQAKEPWEGNHIHLSNGFMYDSDENVFKLWYGTDDPQHNKEKYPDLNATAQIAYAVSSDGLCWERPDLGVNQWNGSKKNNLICVPPSAGDGMTHNIIKDTQTQDPDKRYVALGVERRPRQADDPQQIWSHLNESLPLICGISLGYSADGVRWRREAGPPLMPILLMLDQVVLHGWDKQRCKWMLFIRARSETDVPTVGWTKYRTLGVSFTDDLKEIPYPQLVLVPDEVDPPSVQFDRVSTIEVPGGYVGLLVVLKGSSQQGYPMEVQLAFSRDGYLWDRPAGRKTYFPIGEPGQWDDRRIIPARMACVDDTIYISYRGDCVGSDARPATSAIGMATLKRDRWAAIEPVADSGLLHTRATYFAQNFLKVNADASKGSLRAELLDALGNPVEGFSVAESDPFCGDCLAHAMTWKGISDLTELVGTATHQGRPNPGRIMKVRFYLERSKLFSFSC